MAYNFTIVKKGYDTAEVDAYIAELVSQINSLTEQNLLLTSKLSDAQEMVANYSEAEKNLRRSIADSKIAAADIIEAAQERSETLIEASREESCKIIDDLDRQIEERYQTIETIKANVLDFKNKLFALYSDHIEAIETLSNTAEQFEYNPDFSALSLAIDEFEEGAGSETPELPEFPDIPEDGFFSESVELETEAIEAEEDINVIEETDAAAIIEEFEATDDTSEELPVGDDMFIEAVAPEAEVNASEIFADIDDDMFAPSDVDTSKAMGDAFGTYIDRDDDMFKSATKEDEEYFKFLSDFVNEDDK